MGVYTYEMDRLPGFPSMEIYEKNSDILLESRYPWLEEAFDRLLLKGVPKETLDIFDTYKQYEFPISSMVLMPKGGTEFDVIGFALNQTNAHKSSFAHAEILAIDMGTPATEKHVPKGAVLITTLEPCAMCAAASVRSGLEHVIFGARQDDVRRKSVLIDDKLKHFSVEPSSYTAESFFYERNPGIKVEGPYRISEVLKFMRVID